MRFQIGTIEHARQSLDHYIKLLNDPDAVLCYGKANLKEKIKRYQDQIERYETKQEIKVRDQEAIFKVLGLY